MAQCKVPVVIRGEYVMYLELFDNHLWFHTDILKWTADIKKKYKEDLNKLEDLVNVPLMALIKEDNHKLTKFAKTFNWQSKGQIMLNDGSKGFIYASKRVTGEN
jgi:hypothetical protein